MNMNYMSRLYKDCLTDDVMLMNPSLNEKDIQLISFWNQHPLYTQQEIASKLNISQNAISKRISRINSMTRYFIDKNKLGYTKRERVYSFRKCLMCNTEFVAESHNRFCSDDCRSSRAINQRQEAMDKIKALRVRNRASMESMVFTIDKPKHRRMIPINSISYPEHIRMGLKAYIRKYNLDTVFKYSTFTRKDGFQTRKKVVHISLEGLKELISIKHERYRLTNDVQAKGSYLYWLEIYNTLNIKD